jgi:energy-coupling factor transporter ATP-binding protein EcfA2
MRETMAHFVPAGVVMTFDFSVPTPAGPRAFQVEPGTSLLFVGANGGGKTRLAVSIENDLGERAHRISAHRTLSLDPSVAKVSEFVALQGLRTGNPRKDSSIVHRPGSRWGSNAAVSMLNDFNYIIQALFADQSNTSLETHNNARAGSTATPTLTKFEKLVSIWDRTLPHRKLDITGDDIRASVTGLEEKYSATDMSDGERAIFYLIGQTLAAAANSLLIFDEPELHIHRSIMSRLWDELEAARPDCGIIFISHDLEFVGSREGQKCVLRDYNPATGWIIEDVPNESGFSEEITTLILGSRNPILFVEGRDESLDLAIYRACYPGWTLISRGSCEEVIHAVVTMRANQILTRVTCCGIVDADAHSPSDVQLLQSKGIGVLPVSEIENLFLLPSVTRSIVEAEGFTGSELTEKLESILDELFVSAASPKTQLPVVMRYARRRIDRLLKTIDLSAAATVDDLATEYGAKTAALDVREIAKLATESIEKALADRDAASLLRWYDNKGLLSIAARAKTTTAANFQQWIVRAMRNGTVPAVSSAIRQALPVLTPA